MHGKSSGVVDWQAQGHRSIADEAAHPLDGAFKNSPLPHVVKQLCWYDPVEGPCWVQQQQRSHAVFVLPSCVDLLNQEVKSSVYGTAGASSPELGREKA